VTKVIDACLIFIYISSGFFIKEENNEKIIFSVGAGGLWPADDERLFR
jgi:hypothetical protein